MQNMVDVATLIAIQLTTAAKNCGLVEDIGVAPSFLMPGVAR